MDGTTVQHAGMDEPRSLQVADACGDRDALSHQRFQRALPPDGPAVERPGDLRRRGHTAREQMGLDDPACQCRLRQPRLIDGHAPLGQVPEPLLPVPARDHHLPASPQELEHHRGALPVVVPATGPPALDGAILELPRSKRTTMAQLAQHVAAERCVRVHPVTPIRAPGIARPPTTRETPHRLAMDRVVVDVDDVRPIFEQRMLVPEHALQIGDAEPRAQPAPEHEVLRARDRARRIHLDLAETAHDLLDRARPGCGQELRDDGEPSRVLHRQLQAAWLTRPSRRPCSSVPGTVRPCRACRPSEVAERSPPSARPRPRCTSCRTPGSPLGPRRPPAGRGTP